jgi:dihydrofolate reductase
VTKRSARIAQIVAMADNRVIGANGGLPWRIPADLKHFKAMTMGKPIVMGRRTYDSIGKPLPGRPNIVVSRGRADYPDGVDVAHDIDAAMTIAQRRADEIGADEIMIIGGATLYEATLARADRLYLTEIHGTVDGDTYFPEIDPAAWREVERKDRDDIHNVPVSFVTLDRRRD